MIQGFSSGLLGNRELIYETDLPSFQRDFASLKTLNHGYGPNIDTTSFRGSTATYFDVNGVLQTAANHEPRFDHNPSSGASLGLLIEEARTNSIRNSQAGGSTNGVIGSGGVMPTNWSITGNANGVSSEIIGTGTEDGLSYIDIKFSGTPTSNGSVFIFFDGSSAVIASNGQTWTASNYAKIANGSLSNAVVRTAVRGNLSDGTFVSGQISNPTITPTSSALKTQRTSATVTFSDATVVRVLGYMTVTYTNAQAIDLTLRIAAPQLEQGAFPTSYIPTTNAAATRSADSAVVTPISSFYNQAEGTLFAEAQRITSGPAASFPQVSRFVNTASPTNQWQLLYTTDGVVNFYSFAAVSNVTQFSLGATITQTNINRLAVALAKDNFAASVNGAAASTDALGDVPTGIDSFRLGGASTTCLNGHIRKIAYYPRRLSNTLLQQLTT